MDCEKDKALGVDDENAKKVYINELPDGARAVTAIAKKRKLGFSQQEVENVVKGYTEQRLTIYQLAEKYGCHRNTISKLLKANEVKVTIVRMTDDRVSEAVTLYESDWTLIQIAKHWGFGKATVLRVLHKAGVEMRAACRRAR
jgi:DNA-binding transcriptional regulator LsrR (DeoR family)